MQKGAPSCEKSAPPLVLVAVMTNMSYAAHWALAHQPTKQPTYGTVFLLLDIEDWLNAQKMDGLRSGVL